MKLDFSVFRNPLPKHGGQQGTQGTINVHAGICVPQAVLQTGDTGDNFSGEDALSRDLSRMSPVCPAHDGTEIPNINAVVPRVPLVPSKKEEGCVCEPPADPLRDAPGSLPGPAKAPATKPAPYEFAFDPSGLPILPSGIRLIEWAVKPPPVKLSSYATVVDTEKFIATTLAQLDHLLSGRSSWLAGTRELPVLLGRLAVCGCVVNVEDERAIPVTPKGKEKNVPPGIETPLALARHRSPQRGDAWEPEEDADTSFDPQEWKT